MRRFSTPVLTVHEKERHRREISSIVFQYLRYSSRNLVAFFFVLDPDYVKMITSSHMIFHKAPFIRSLIEPYRFMI